MRNTLLLGPYQGTLYLGSYGGSWGEAVSYERGTPVLSHAKQRTVQNRFAWPESDRLVVPNHMVLLKDVKVPFQLSDSTL